MRRSLPLFAGSFLTLAQLTFGCAGAETQDVLARDVSGQAASSSGNGSSGTTSSGGTSGNTTSGGTSGNNTSGGPITQCAQEDEPNDDERNANALAPARCGTVSREDSRDFLTFRLKPATKSLSLTFSGQVRLRIEVGDQRVELTTATSSTPVPFEMGKPYMIEVQPLVDMSQEIPWQVRVDEK
jgi:hypothetical protein